ncbi:ABC transporter permease [uncultured Clostridium sp.]|uniref:ABC transporter permease n=1 Tax=uncultured Clostridium sp. TaxID=59620 RepID=UPI00258F46AA|nr:ABC transporter permease [uncultured Clostridium sp.]
MRLIRLTIINLKRILKNPAIFFMSLLLPMVVLFGVVGPMSQENSLGKIGIINKSSGKYSEKIIDNLSEKYEVENLEGNIEDSYDRLRDKKLAVIYVLDENFEDNINIGRTPKIKAYSVESGMGSIIAENIITESINKFLEEHLNIGLSKNSVEAIIVENNKNNTSDFYMTVLMICYFMLIGGSILTDDIIKLRTQKVLKRTISTGNSDKTILGSLYLSAFVLQSLMSSITLFISIKLFKIENYNFFNGILTIILCSLMTTATIVAATRWLKNQTIASLAVVIFGLVSFGLGIIGNVLREFVNVPDYLVYLSIISPFSWLGKIINNESIVLPIIIIILMSAVLFTAGSFKLRDYVKE